MFSHPYKNIPRSIQDILDNIILPKDYYHNTHKRRMARTLDVLLQEPLEGKILELGTSKVIPLSLKTLVPQLEVHVTDFDLEQPETGVMDMSLGSESGSFPVYRVDLETQFLPVEDESFDFVLCCEVIEHMEVDPMFMMSEINRVLKPNGVLILTTPNITSSRAIWKILRGMEPHFYMQYRHKPSLYRHNYEYSMLSMVSVLKAAGFSGKVWTEDSFEDPELEDVLKLREMGYALSSVGDNIFAVVRKVSPVVDRHPSVIYAD